MNSEPLDLLRELRQRLITLFLFWLSFFCLAWHFDEQLLHIVTQPLLNAMHADHLIATSVVTPLFTLMHLSMITATALSIPVIAWQVTRFLMPALYPHEKKRLILTLMTSTGLLALGIYFAYALFQPLFFNFLHAMIPQSVELLPDMHDCLLTILKLALMSALLFQMPIIVYTLLEFQWLTPDYFTQARPYLILICFTLGMLLTPPDVISQILLAIPLWLLIELGVLTYKLVKKRSS